MKALCIDDMGNDGIKLQIKEGSIYEVLECPRNGFYIVVGFERYMGGLACYEKWRFVPISHIDETELIKERQTEYA